jgi:hypothetical protein
MYNIMQAKPNFVTGTFKDLASAQKAYENLLERGYRDEDINVIMSEESLKRYFKQHNEDTDFGNKAKAVAGTGSVIGGAIGAATGIIAAIGTSVIIPGLGFVIAGPIAAGLAGAGAGGITGGVVGALIGAGMPREKAREYEQGIKEGYIIVGVNVHNQEDARIIGEYWSNDTNNETV